MTWIRNELNFLHTVVQKRWNLHDQKGRPVSPPFWGFLFNMFVVFFFPGEFFNTQMNMTWTWAPCSMRRITHLWAIAEGDSPTHQKKRQGDSSGSVGSTSQPVNHPRFSSQPKDQRSPNQKPWYPAAWMMDMSKLFCVSGMLDYFILFHNVWLILKW